MAWVQSEDSQQRGEWGVEDGRGGRSAEEVAAVTGFVSCMFMCVSALRSVIIVSFYEFVFNLLTSVLQQRAVNLISYVL